MNFEKKQDIGSKNGHDHCLLCGIKNPWSLKLSFDFDGRQATALFRPNPGLQGYRGIIHGGVISAMLDSAMTNCLFHHGIQAVTGELKVKFVHSVPCHQAIFLRAWIESSRSPLYLMKSELSLNEKTMARADAKFMKINYLSD